MNGQSEDDVDTYELATTIGLEECIGAKVFESVPVPVVRYYRERCLDVNESMVPCELYEVSHETWTEPEQGASRVLDTVFLHRLESAIVFQKIEHILDDDP